MSSIASRTRQLTRDGYVFNFQDLTELRRLEQEVATKERMAALEGAPVARATAMLNVRATCSPADLESLVRSAALDADLATGAAARPGPASAFAPSYPRPVHRLTAAQA